MLGHEFGGEEAQQRDNSQRKGQPVKARVQGNAEYCSCEGQNGTHDELAEYVGEEQYDQQATNGSKKERFSPQGNAWVGEQLAYETKRFSEMKEDVQALWAAALAAERLRWCIAIVIRIRQLLL